VNIVEKNMNLDSMEQVQNIVLGNVITKHTKERLTVIQMVNYRFHQQCPLCNMAFMNKTDLRNHKYEAHAN